MKMESQICTPAQAEKLHELGIIQIALLEWVKFTNTETSFEGDYLIKNCGIGELSAKKILNENLHANCIYHSAFNVAELGVMLMGKCISGNWFHDKLPCGLYDGGGNLVHTEYGETEAQVRAAMLIYLFETGMVTAEECNNRLQFA